MVHLLDGDTDNYDIVAVLWQGDTFLFIICLFYILWHQYYNDIVAVICLGDTFLSIICLFYILWHQLYYDIVAVILQSDTFLFIIYLFYILNVNGSNERKWSYTKKVGSRWYSMATITDADYTDDLVFLVSTPVSAKSLLHNLEQTATGIGLYMNSNNTEFMLFKQDCAASSFNGKPLKSVYQFIYLGCNISSIKSNVTICMDYYWLVIDHTEIWSLSWNKIGILSSFSRVSTTVQQLTCALTKYMEKKLNEKSEKPHSTKQQLYSNLLPISWTMMNSHAGHCWGSKEKLISDVFNVSWPVKSSIDQPCVC